jgi:hypothetical protein
MTEIIGMGGIEPLRANRWVINFVGYDITDFLFRKYKIFNDADKLMFSTEVLETVGYQINPKKLFNIEQVKIEFLDPIGSVVNGFTFNVKSMLFEQIGDYASDELLTYKILIEMDKSTMNPIYVIENSKSK